MPTETILISYKTGQKPINSIQSLYSTLLKAPLYTFGHYQNSYITASFQNILYNNSPCISLWHINTNPLFLRQGHCKHLISSLEPITKSLNIPLYIAAIENNHLLSYLLSTGFKKFFPTYPHHILFDEPEHPDAIKFT
jgi:hypothetical protein